MVEKNYSKYQQGVIDRYYENRDTIMLTKLQELSTELYLASGNEKKLTKLWERVDKAMKNLKVAPKLHAHIMDKRDVEVLARNVNDWLKKKA